MNFSLRRITIATALVASASFAQADPFTLTFEGAGNQANLNNFYNGGTDSLGNIGTNYGVEFGANALTVIDSDAGGTGNIANEPSASTVMFFLTGSAVLNYDAGFNTGFSFYYSSFYDATVKVYDGLGATGTLLGSINLSAQHNKGCVGDPSGAFCNWSIGSVAFGGNAKSIDFGGTVNYVGYDNITFGSTNPAVTAVPEPESYAMMLAGLGLIGAIARRRKAKQTA